LYLRGRRRKSAAAAGGVGGGSVGAVDSAPDDATARPWRIARRAARVSVVSCDEPTAPGVSVGSRDAAPGSPAIQSAAASSASLSGMLTNRFRSDFFGVMRFVVL
jgi:hypothetical protein